MCTQWLNWSPWYATEWALCTTIWAYSDSISRLGTPLTDWASCTIHYTMQLIDLSIDLFTICMLIPLTDVSNICKHLPYFSLPIPHSPWFNVEMCIIGSNKAWLYASSSQRYPFGSSCYIAMAAAAANAVLCRLHRADQRPIAGWSLVYWRAKIDRRTSYTNTIIAHILLYYLGGLFVTRYS